MSTELSIAAEVWGIVKPALSSIDRETFAHEVVGMLIDHGFELDDIQHEFKTDKSMQQAIKFHSDDESVDDDWSQLSDDEDSDW